MCESIGAKEEYGDNVEMGRSHLLYKSCDSEFPAHLTDTKVAYEFIL